MCIDINSPNKPKHKDVKPAVCRPCDLENEKKCLEVIDRALKRLVGPAILIGFSLYFLDIALDQNVNIFLYFICYIYYYLIFMLALKYIWSVWRIALGEFDEIKDSKSEVQIYIIILAGCYISSLIVAALAMFKQLS